MIKSRPWILAKLKDQMSPSGKDDQHSEGSTCPFPGSLDERLIPRACISTYDLNHYIKVKIIFIIFLAFLIWISHTALSSTPKNTS